MKRALEVTFERQGGSWQVRFRGATGSDSAGSDSGPYAWEVPSKERDLFSAIARFAPGHFVDAPARLRITVVPDGERPPGVMNWAHMVERRGERHIHTLGWALSQRTSTPVANVLVSPKVAAFGSDDFIEGLRRWFSTVMLPVRSANEVPVDTMCVVQDLDEDRAGAWQQTLEQQRCPLVIWCRNGPLHAYGDLTEIVRTRHSTEPRSEPDTKWLSRLIPKLRAGVDPEIALRDACVAGDRGASFRWWLRGIPYGAGWKVDGVGDSSGERWRDWHIRLDRSAQERAREELVEELLAPAHPSRRVLGIVVSGPRSARVDLFTLRPPAPLARDAVPDFEFDWGEDPGAMVQRLHRELNVRTVAQVASALAERCRAKGHTTERPALVWVRPHVVRWQGAPGDDEEVDATQLRRVLGDLSSLATALRPHGHVRVLVDIGVHDATRAMLRQFRSGDDGEQALRVEVLPEVRSSIPEDDLIAFLDRIGAGSDGASIDDVVEKIKGLPYDDLVNELWRLYSNKLGAG